MNESSTTARPVGGSKKEVKDPLRHYIAGQLSASWTREVEAIRETILPTDSFLERFVAIAGAHLSETDFGVKELLPEMNTSRTQLHRKLKALTGQSAHELIRTIKMQKALLLLQNTRLPVAKVARQVGFLSVSHFSTVFRRHFGFLPSAAKQQTDKK